MWPKVEPGLLDGTFAFDAPSTDGRGMQREAACTSCGKRFKQHNSYAKHMYEHHPYWRTAVEGMLPGESKHATAALLQCASVLYSLRRPAAAGGMPTVRI